MNMSKCCYMCTDRHLGCHSICSKYIEAKAESEERKEKERKEKERLYGKSPYGANHHKSTALKNICEQPKGSLRRETTMYR